MNNIEKKKDLLIELIEEYNTKNKDKQFTGTDVDIETSLFEYGLLVSKENNSEYFVLYCIDYAQFDDNNKIMFDYTRIDINDLIDDLNNIDNSFYSFIDMQKNDVINETKNTKNIWFIAHMIYSINQYNGLYNDTCNYNDNIDTWINYFKNLLLN